MRYFKIAIECVLVITIMGDCGRDKNFKKIPVAVYQDKVYASWLGQMIGNIAGLPHENRHIDQPGPETFPYGYGENLEYLKEVKGAFSDDDTDLEYMYLLAMEKNSPEPTYVQLTEAWEYHIRQRVWLANRAALAAMHYGYTPPVTGMKSFNPHWFQIDPQLINEIWAVTSPGMIEYAAQKSGWAARITDDSWGIEPTIHYGAMYAAAFFESDIRKLIDIGTKALPPGSRFAQTVEDMKSWYQKYPNDWKKARQELAEKYYINEPSDSKTIWNANLNGACGILALLYGEGDFQKTLDFACAMGFDADNQAATMSGLMGVILGTKGLPENMLYPVKEWTRPFNDLYKNVSRYDLPDASIIDMAHRTAAQGEKIILKNGGKKITENGIEYYLINLNAEFLPPLELPGAPMPYIEVGKDIDFEFYLSGSKPAFTWKVISGDMPDALHFSNGKLTGITTKPGIFPVTIEVADGGQKTSREFNLVVRGPNLAPAAARIIANVMKTDTTRRDAMWVTVPRSLYADSVQVIRDGNCLGDHSTFYSINGDTIPKIDYYGYEWDAPQTIGLLGYHTGSVEENGGWFTSLNVEFQDGNGNWKPVENLVIYPRLPEGLLQFNKPHFVEYLLAFEPVQTNAIRMVGDAGGTKHWYSKRTYFTSISELRVHGSLPGYRKLQN